MNQQQPRELTDLEKQLDHLIQQPPKSLALLEQLPTLKEHFFPQGARVPVEQGIQVGRWYLTRLPGAAFIQQVAGPGCSVHRLEGLCFAEDANGLNCLAKHDLRWPKSGRWGAPDEDGVEEKRFPADDKWDLIGEICSKPLLDVHPETYKLMDGLTIVSPRPDERGQGQTTQLVASGMLGLSRASSWASWLQQQRVLRKNRAYMQRQAEQGEAVLYG